MDIVCAPVNSTVARAEFQIVLINLGRRRMSKDSWFGTGLGAGYGSESETGATGGPKWTAEMEYIIEFQLLQRSVKDLGILIRFTSGFKATLHVRQLPTPWADMDRWLNKLIHIPALTGYDTWCGTVCGTPYTTAYKKKKQHQV